MKNKYGYKFPSGLPVDPAEVERPLRRKFRTRKEIPTWFLLLLGIIIATLAYFIVGRVVDDQAHAAEVSRESTYSTLCEQYKSDSELVGTAAEDTLNKICNK